MKEWAATCGFCTSAFNGQKFQRIQLRTIGQLLAGIAIERPSGNVAVDETFRKARKAALMNKGVPFSSRPPAFMSGAGASMNADAVATGKSRLPECPACAHPPRVKSFRKELWFEPRARCRLANFSAALRRESDRCFLNCFAPPSRNFQRQKPTHENV
jgi:hypothetical protein